MDLSGIEHAPLHAIQLDIQKVLPEAPIALFDGVHAVRKITVLGILRNCASWLPFFFQASDAMEKCYDCTFEYFFLESGSTDHTQELLEDWFEKKEGKLLLYNQKTDYVRTKHGMDFARIDTICRLRNKLLDYVRPLSSDYTLMLDADIYFSPRMLEKMFAVEPAKHNIGMVCPNTQQLSPANAISAALKRPNQLVSCRHYYDTYAFVSIEGKGFHPLCPLASCLLCPKYDAWTQRIRIPDTEDHRVIDVRSAFGGFVLLESGLLRDPRIRFDTLSYEPKNDLSLCEHILFQDRLRTITGKRIVLCQDVDDIYRTK